MLTYPKTPSEMSKTQWPHTLHLSQNPKKLYIPVSKSEGLVCPVTAIIQIPEISVSKPDVSVSTDYFPTASF
jgi:hypothetical protein